jgi:biopolymer transport protein ExbD
MSQVRFHCPGCSKRLVAPESAAGRQSTCPQCGTKVTVPRADDVQAPAERTAAAATADESPLSLRAPKSHSHDLIDMTAMVDIVFFLLIFFLVTTIQSLDSVINLPSPKRSSNSSTTSQPTNYFDDPTFIVVTIDEDDLVYIENEEVYGDQNLRAKLRALRREDPDRTGMLVIGNPDATHGTLVSVLDAGADAGIKELLFSVTDRPEDAGG